MSAHWFAATDRAPQRVTAAEHRLEVAAPPFFRRVSVTLLNMEPQSSWFPRERHFRRQNLA
jgi:hypothetical protein